MPVGTDFLPVAATVGANVDSQVAFAGSGYQLNGFSNGIALPAQANKIWRQSSMFAAAFALMFSNIENVLVPDDGNLNSLMAIIWNGLLADSYFIDTGSANTLSMGAPAGLTFPAPFPGLLINLKLANTITGPTTFNYCGHGALAVTTAQGSALQGGEGTVNQSLPLIYTGTNWQISSGGISSSGYRHLNVYQVIGGSQLVSVDGAAYTATGATVFTPPPNGVFEIEMWGGGGGSGGGNGTGALPGGGGGGEYARGRFAGVTAAQGVVVGTPGVAGVSSGSPASGGNGGTSSVGSLISAVGGGGGAAQSGAGSGAGGVGGLGGVGGQFRVTGNAASLGFPITGAYVGSEGGGTFGVSNNEYEVATATGAGQPAYAPGGGGGAPVSGGVPQTGASGWIVIRY